MANLNSTENGSEKYLFYVESKKYSCIFCGILIYLAIINVRSYSNPFFIDNSFPGT